MAEIKSPAEPTFPSKRKPDINCEDSHGHQNKAQKLETLEDKSLAPSDDAKHREASLIANDNVGVLHGNCPSVTDEKVEKVESEAVAEDGGDEGGNLDHCGAEDDEDEGEDDDGEESDGEVVVDRKGKGIITADKGKGKLIEEDAEDVGSDDDDDSSDDGVVSDGDSDLSDDPLAEVDLNNILPSRTRRRTIHPGEYIANDLGNDDDDDDDDSDDSDI